MSNETTEYNDEDKDRLISLKEAAKRSGFNSVYLRNLIRRGRLQGEKIGNSWATTQSWLEEYIESRKRRGVYRDDIDLD